MRTSIPSRTPTQVSLQPLWCDQVSVPKTSSTPSSVHILAFPVTQRPCQGPSASVHWTKSPQDSLGGRGVIRQKHPSSFAAVQSSCWRRTPGCVWVEETMEGPKSAERPSRGDSYPYLADPQALRMFSLGNSVSWATLCLAGRWQAPPGWSNQNIGK